VLFVCFAVVRISIRFGVTRFEDVVSFMSFVLSYVVLWLLECGLVFLNHGFFGVCFTEVLWHQSVLWVEMEVESVRFFFCELDGCFDVVRMALVVFVGVVFEDLVFVINATSGVNAVFCSFLFGYDDELLIIDYVYKVCWNMFEFVVEWARARVVVAPIFFLLIFVEDVVGVVLLRVMVRTCLVFFDYVMSPIVFILLIEWLIVELGWCGIDVFVDGVHALGMLFFDLGALGAVYYSGNCYKWFCAFKGSVFLWVRCDR